MGAIVLDGVSKRYGATVALDRVDLEIADGAFQSVFGPTGSGKSALMRLLLGLEAPDAGRIIIDGRDVTGLRPRERDLAMVFQNLALFPHLTARENIVFPLVRRRVPGDEIARRLDAVVAPLGIAHVLGKKPAALSGGERQRVALGRSLIRDARAYLMDEPIAALDARLREGMRVELKRLQAERGRTFLYVSHDHEEAMSVADRMAILRGGRVVQEGAPDAIYADPDALYVAELVGAPAINVLSGALTEGGFEGPHGRLPWNAGLPAPQGAFRVAVRPEAVGLVEAGRPRALAATVEDVEPLGGHSIVALTAGAAALRAVVPGMARIAAGARVGLALEPRDFLVFDAAGRRIRAR